MLFRSVKIIDFGFAASTLASIGQPIRGTLEYIAPELLRGDAYDERIDLYSLGATLFEIAARETPFGTGDATSIIKQHLSSPPPSLEEKRPDLAPHIGSLVTRLLQKDPAQRVHSAASIAESMRGTFARETLYRNVLVHIPVHMLVGRDKESDRLLRFIGGTNPDDRETNAHPAVFITGTTGIGKTSLLQDRKSTRLNSSH